MNAIVSALRFFFIQALVRPDLARKLVRMRYERKMPVVLSQDEVARLLEASTRLKHQAALSVAYGAGLAAAISSAVCAAVRYAPRPLYPALSSDGASEAACPMRVRSSL